MANPEHTRVLAQGIEAWNEWREKNPEITPDLHRTKFYKVVFRKDHAQENFIFTFVRQVYENTVLRFKIRFLRFVNSEYEDRHFEGESKMLVQTENTYYTRYDWVYNGTKGVGEILEGGDPINTRTEDYFGLRNTELIFLGGCKLRGANLKGINFQGADLAHSDLIGVNLWDANLCDADLTGANLSGADLTSANLKGAKLLNTNFFGADLDNAILERVNLSRANEYTLDANRVLYTQFAYNAKDPWSTLRRKYTGPMLLFNTIFLVGFIIPFLLKAVLWVGINNGQEAASGIADSLAIHSLRVDTNLKSLMDSTEKKLATIDSSLVASLSSISSVTDIDMAIDGIENLEIAVQQLDSSSVELVQGVGDYLRSKLPDPNLFSKCLRPQCEEFRVVSLLLSADRSKMSFFLVIGLLIYNFCRAILTWRVGLLRDAEERSDVTPAYESYKTLYYAHVFVLKPLVIISLMAFVYHAWYWLWNTTVSLPA